MGGTAITVSGVTETGDVKYYPFGTDRFTSGTTPTSFRYTGQQQESGLGLYYYGARWYDPALGRFVQPDTIVPDPGDAKSFDRYAYVLNNPLKYSDPTGHNVAYFTGGGSCAQVGMCYTMLSQHQAQQQVDEFNAFALNVAASVPYADTGEDWLVATTGCGYSCQAGYEEPVGWGWRSASTVAIVLPFGYRSIRSAFELAESGADIIHASRTVGRVMEYNTTRKGFAKLDMLFNNRNDAMNWAKAQLGQNVTRQYDEGGKWIGWVNAEGDSVYWGHNDWYTGEGKSIFPHLNFDIDGVSGHLFLEDKIRNNELWQQFTELFGIE